MSGISGMGGMMGRMRPDPQQMFNRVDQDGSGGLDMDELSTATDNIAERTGNTVDAVSLMEAYDGDGVLNQDETHAAMEGLREQMGPPPGGMQGPKPEKESSGVYGQDGSGSDTSIDQLLAALEESEEDEEAQGLIQEWIETLKGGNASYSPLDIQA